MRTALSHPAFVEDQNAVNVPHQPKLVGYNEGGAAFGQGTPTLFDCGGCFSVEAGLGFVQDQDGTLS
jgi:hypothetical protein